MRVGAVDCDVHKELASKYGVKGFPTLKTFGEDKTAPPVDYTGAREAAAIVAHGQAALGAPGGGGGRLVTALTYLSTHSFLYQSGVPAVALLTEGGAKTAPAWLTSLAVKYKDGKTRKVVFGHARADEEPAIAARFGVTTFPALLALVPTGAAGEGHAVRFDKAIPASAAAALRELREFVDAVLAGEDAAERRLPAPAFPAPDVPRKLADVAYAPLTEDNLRSACLGGKKSMCVLALVAAPGGEFRQDGVMQELARKYRNGAICRAKQVLRDLPDACSAAADPFSFVWLDVGAQPEFAATLGVTPADVPALLVIKHGKRPRFARHQGALSTAAEAAPFLDRVLGGDVTFAPLKELPELMSDAMRDALRSAEAEL